MMILTAMVPLSPLQRSVCGRFDGDQPFEQRGEVGEGQHGRGVGKGVRRVRVRFQEERVDADGDGGAAERRDELALAAGRCPLPARAAARRGSPSKTIGAPVETAICGRLRKSTTSVL